MYEFDLVYSEDLGEQLYSNKKVRCCLNIFKRNKNGLNKKPNYKLKEVIIKSGERHNDEKRNNYYPDYVHLQCSLWNGNC